MLSVYDVHSAVTRSWHDQLTATGQVAVFQRKTDMEIEW